MKLYQVTRKRQVTLPKKLAEKRGIKPGDTVVFEESEDAIILRKSSSNNRKEDLDNIRRAIRRYSNDIPKIKEAVKLSEASLIENLSRHLSPK
ncbi:MAG: AbrB/MazE/SpoVT family DNA-binding domain-containing protein [Thaumarchaeota archaeon]|nr:AbrB/MazE/SpoVT family DNA-binding domain-containing protein [Nitrososphaerota archaeon]